MNLNLLSGGSLSVSPRADDKVQVAILRGRQFVDEILTLEEARQYLKNVQVAIDTCAMNQQAKYRSANGLEPVQPASPVVEQDYEQRDMSAGNAGIGEYVDEYDVADVATVQTATHSVSPVDVAAETA